MNRPRSRIVLVGAYLTSASIAAFVAGTSLASDEPHDPHAHHRAMASSSSAINAQEASLNIRDAEVHDHHGAARHFAELLPDGPVAINFIFTTCTTICPPMGATFAKLEHILDATGSTTKLISVTVDPLVDTPERLSSWVGRFRGDNPSDGDRWTLVTGDKREIDRLLKSLRVFTPDKIDHAPIVLLGDTRSGRWLRANALAPPEQLITGLESLAPGSPVTGSPVTGSPMTGSPATGSTSVQPGASEVASPHTESHPASGGQE